MLPDMLLFENELLEGCLEVVALASLVVQITWILLAEPSWLLDDCRCIAVGAVIFAVELAGEVTEMEESLGFLGIFFFVFPAAAMLGLPPETQPISGLISHPGRFPARMLVVLGGWFSLFPACPEN